MVTAWRSVTILLVALLQGLAFAHVLERPAKLTYDGRFYMTLQRTLYVQWGPPNVGGILEPAAIAATAILAFLVRRNTLALWSTVAALALLLAAFPGAFYFWVAPANDFFLNTMPGILPQKWMAMRDSWETGHAVRFALQLAALALLVVPLAREASAGKS